MITDHTFKPYADMPYLCVEELVSGDTCNRARSEHDGSDTKITDPDQLLELFKQQQGLTIMDPAHTGRSPIPGEISIHSIRALAEQGGLTRDEVEELATHQKNRPDWRGMPSSDFDIAMQQWRR